MANIPADLKYAKSHEWARIAGDTATVGITDDAQHQMGELVFVELPELGRKVKAGDACAIVESTKAASDVYSPLSGEIVEINQAAAESHGVINTDPYGKGWLFRLKLSNPAEANALLNPDQYRAQISGS
jgi:glycine cleavage system H protein